MARIVWAIAAGALIFSSGSVVAQTRANMAKIACGEVLELYVDEFVVIGAWMSGYYNAKRNNTTIDVKQLAANTAKVIDYCRNNPKVTVMKAIEKLSGAKK